MCDLGDARGEASNGALHIGVELFGERRRDHLVAHRRKRQCVEHRDPPLRRGIGGERLARALGEAGGQLRGQGGTRLGGTRADPKSSDDPSNIDRGGQLGQPCGVLSVHASCQAFLELLGEGSGLFVLGTGISGRHHRAQIAQVKVLEVALGSFGSISPLRGTDPRYELLGDVEERARGDGRLASGHALRVLLLDRLTDRRKSSQHHLISDGALLGG